MSIGAVTISRGVRSSMVSTIVGRGIAAVATISIGGHHGRLAGVAAHMHLLVVGAPLVLASVTRSVPSVTVAGSVSSVAIASAIAVTSAVAPVSAIGRVSVTTITVASIAIPTVSTISAVASVSTVSTISTIAAIATISTISAIATIAIRAVVGSLDSNGQDTGQQHRRQHDENTIDV